MTHLSKTTTEVAWPSSESLLITQISPFFHLCCCWVGLWVTLISFLGSWGVSDLFLLIKDLSMNLCSLAHVILLVSCWLFWHQACVRPTQQISQSRDYKVHGGGRTLCLFAPTLPQLMMMRTDIHIWSHWWQMRYALCFLAIFWPFKSACSYRCYWVSNSHRDIHISSWRQTPCNARFPLSLSPRHLRLLLCIISHTQKYTQRCAFTQKKPTHIIYRNMCWAYCFS